MKEFGLISSTRKNLSPRLYYLLVYNADKDKDEESLERVKDSKENLSDLSESIDGEGEDSKEPGESKQEHHSTDADHQTSNCFLADWFVQSSCRISCVTNHHYNDSNEDEYVEQHDYEDWSKKSSPESSNMGQKTTITLQKVK